MISVYIKRVLSVVLAFSLSFSLLFQTAYAAPVFSDVDSSHWAYSSIIRIADLGVIVGDTEGRYNPNDYIDKFETAKILARISGYKQYDYTESEKAFYDKAYEKNRAYLNQYGKTYKKWNTTADRQIAFLLEKEILTPDDLKDFVGIKSDGTEGIRALTKECAAMFVTKAVGKKTDALTTSLPVLYLDDQTISAAARPYVYYLKSAGFMSGDEKNNFSPREPITKADMAVLLDKVFSYANIEPAQISGIPDSAESINLSVPDQMETVTATFSSFYKSHDINAVQLTLSDGTRKIYKVSPGLTIYINGFLKTESDLEEGMNVLAVLSNNEIVDIKADTLNGKSEITVADKTNISLVSIEGIVLSTSSDNVVKTISVEVKIQNPSGETITEVKSYLLSENCVITRNKEDSSFEDIEKGDIISAEVSGTRLHSMSLEQKSRIIEARFVTAKRNRIGVVIFTISDSGREYDLTFENSAKVTRDGLPSSWQELRTGDLLNLFCEYDRIRSIDAFGVKKEVTGVLTQLKITDSASFVTVSGDDGEATYKVIPARVDVYSLRVGSLVLLHLDSLEAELVQNLEEAKNPRYITGYISHKRTSTVVMTNLGAMTQTTTEIGFNDKTIFTDSNTGEIITYADIPDKAKIYVVLDDSLKTALYVTIL